MPRPAEYKDEYPDELYELMVQGQKGASLHAHFGVSKRTFYNWIDKYPEFKDAYERGWEQCEKWWETFGLQKMLEGDERGYKYWKDFMAKNFGYGKGENGSGQNGAMINIGSINIFKEQSKEDIISFIEQKLVELPVLDVTYDTIDVKKEDPDDE